jgi:hypothetical protein
MKKLIEYLMFGEISSISEVYIMKAEMENLILG